MISVTTKSTLRAGKLALNSVLNKSLNKSVIVCPVIVCPGLGSKCI